MPPNNGVPGGYQVSLQGFIKSGLQDRSFSNLNLQNRTPAAASQPHDFTTPSQPNISDAESYLGPFDSDHVESVLENTYYTANRSEVTGTSADSARRAVAADPNLLLQTVANAGDPWADAQLREPRLLENDPAVQSLDLSPINLNQLFDDEMTGSTVSSGDTIPELLQMVTRAEAERATRIDAAIANGFVSTRDRANTNPSWSPFVARQIDDMLQRRRNRPTLTPSMADSDTSSVSEFGFRDLGFGLANAMRRQSTTPATPASEVQATPVHTPSLLETVLSQRRSATQNENKSETSDMSEISGMENWHPRALFL